MICEMCGKNVPSTRPVFIDGARLSVCPNCARFGDENRGNARGGGAGASPTVIEQRLERRNRRMQTKNVYDGNDNVRIVDGYGEIIRKAHTARGMDLKQFAESIGEKQGLLAKVEAETLIPDDKLVKKIEKALDIKLTEVVASGGSVGGGSRNDKMTLANFIKKE